MNFFGMIPLTFVFLPFLCTTSVWALKVEQPYTTGLQWKQIPKIDVNNVELGCQDRTINTYIEANEYGEITAVTILKSSGIIDLDKKIISSIKNTSFYPYATSNIYHPIRVTQKFELELEDSFFMRFFKINPCA